MQRLLTKTFITAFLSLCVLSITYAGLFTTKGEIETMKFAEPKQAMSFEKDKIYEATIHTSKGDIVCELNPEQAPLSVTNFIQLAKGRFYDKLTFHRYEPGFVIQGGDPDGTGSGGPGYTVPAEIGMKHKRGALAWARLGDQMNPQKRSSGSQFYITLKSTPFLDGQYTVFGYVTEGMDNVLELRKDDTIESVDIVVKDKPSATTQQSS
ncbi:MAG: hypothetical protein K0S74_100 [Chlamydiales bacterium]|jgi:cyclophilin family peptidyl-prolyl cis-trans isomerase|nr:hypothetical protein [Chlamydiales bacterium]